MGKYLQCSMFLFFIMIACSCNNMNSEIELKERLVCLLRNEEFQRLSLQLDSMEHSSGELTWFADSLRDNMKRYRLEFPNNERQILERLKQNGITNDKEFLQKWKDCGMLEYKIIDGEKRYFKRGVHNLLLLSDSLQQVTGQAGINDGGLGDFCVANIESILNSYDRSLDGTLLQSVPMILNYSLKIKPGVVPDNTNIDFGQAFCPAKKWPRSEPWDFQRGEVEWEQGNLCFNQRSYHMGVEYLTER